MSYRGGGDRGGFRGGRGGGRSDRGGGRGGRGRGSYEEGPPAEICGNNIVNYNIYLSCRGWSFYA